MKLEIEISEQTLEMLGDNPTLKLQQLAEKEALRLWHIKRSQPKEKAPVGRPKLDDTIKQCRMYAEQLRGVFNRLREFHGPELFQTAFGQLDAELEQAIEINDLDTLLRFHTEQPWVRRHK
jgi:hypothetical protein